jgi:hypothetical protein
MKKKYLIMVLAIALAGTTLSGCYYGRLHYHPYHHYRY